MLWSWLSARWWQSRPGWGHRWPWVVTSHCPPALALTLWRRVVQLGGSCVRLREVSQAMGLSSCQQ